MSGSTNTDRAAAMAAYLHCTAQVYLLRGRTGYQWEICGCEACATYRVRRELELQGVIGAECRDEPYRKS